MRRDLRLVRRRVASRPVRADRRSRLPREMHRARGQGICQPLMPRPILDESRIHPAIREKIAASRTAIVREVDAAIAANEIVLVGMRLNFAVRKARKRLDEAGIAYKYLGYGGYL